MTEKRPKTIIIKKDSLQPFILPNSSNANQFIYLNKNTMSDKTPKYILIKQPTNVPVLLTKQAIKKENTTIEQNKVVVLKREPAKMDDSVKPQTQTTSLKLARPFKKTPDVSPSTPNKMVIIKKPQTKIVTQKDVKPAETKKPAPKVIIIKNEQSVIPVSPRNDDVKIEILKSPPQIKYETKDQSYGKVVTVETEPKATPGIFKTNNLRKHLTTERLPSIIINKEPDDSEMFTPVKILKEESGLTKVGQTVTIKHEEEMLDEDSQFETEYLEDMNETTDTVLGEGETEMDVETELVEITVGAESDMSSPLKREFNKHEDSYMEIITEEPSDELECCICNIQFESEQDKETHMTEEHTYSYECTQCGLTTHNADAARVHFRQEHQAELVYEEEEVGYEDEEGGRSQVQRITSGGTGGSAQSKKIYTDGNTTEMMDFCEDCDMAFETKQMWVKHILTTKKHRCDRKVIYNGCRYCGETFLSSPELKKHIEQEHPDSRPASKRPRTGPLPCALCGEIMPTTFKYWAHFRRAHPGETYPLQTAYQQRCEECGKEFRCLALLKMHQNKHKGVKPYVCSECGKSFYTNLSLRYHLTAHSDYRPFRCHICDRGFKFKAGVERHQLVHTGERPYVCGICGQGFTTMHWTQLHVRKVHNNEHIPYKPRIRKRPPKKPKVEEEESA